MYEHGFPFDNAGIDNLDRNASSDEFSDYLEMITGMEHGVYPNPSTGLQVIASQGMSIVIKSGGCIIKGKIRQLKEDTQVSLCMAETLDRIDRIVMRLDRSKRHIVPYVIKGTGATSPVAPAVTRSGDIYDIALADVYVTKLSMEITQSQITDLRSNTSLCGYMPVFGRFDTTSLFNQYQDALSRYLDLVGAAIDDTMAGHLQTQIDDIKAVYMADTLSHTAVHKKFDTVAELKHYIETRSRHFYYPTSHNLAVGEYLILSENAPDRNDRIHINIINFCGIAQGLIIDFGGANVKIDIRNNQIPIYIYGIHAIVPEEDSGVIRIFKNTGHVGLCDITINCTHNSDYNDYLRTFIKIELSTVYFNNMTFASWRVRVRNKCSLRITYSRQITEDDMVDPCIYCVDSKLIINIHPDHPDNSICINNANTIITAIDSDIYLKTPITGTNNKYGIKLIDSIFKQSTGANISATSRIISSSGSLVIYPDSTGSIKSGQADLRLVNDTNIGYITRQSYYSICGNLCTVMFDFTFNGTVPASPITLVLSNLPAPPAFNTTMCNGVLNALNLKQVGSVPSPQTLVLMQNGLRFDIYGNSGTSRSVQAANTTWLQNSTRISGTFQYLI